MTTRPPDKRNQFARMCGCSVGVEFRQVRPFCEHQQSTTKHREIGNRCVPGFARPLAIAPRRRRAAHDSRRRPAARKPLRRTRTSTSSAHRGTNTAGDRPAAGRRRAGDVWAISRRADHPRPVGAADQIANREHAARLERVTDCRPNAGRYKSNRQDRARHLR